MEVAMLRPCILLAVMFTSGCAALANNSSQSIIQAMTTSSE
jgi:hypothetical protein